MHFNPFNVFDVMLKGAFGKEFLIRETVKGTIPLVITATGLSLAFRMKFWNIGGEGQILIGGIAATAVSFIFGGQFRSGFYYRLWQQLQLLWQDCMA